MMLLFQFLRLFWHPLYVMVVLCPDFVHIMLFAVSSNPDSFARGGISFFSSFSS